MKKKVFVTRMIPEIGLNILRAHNIDVVIYPKELPPTQKELCTLLKKDAYDGVLCQLTDSIDEQIFQSAPTVKIFANYAVGYNNIDIAEANKRGVTITNTGGASSIAVAEHTVSLMLSLSTRSVEGDAYVRSGKYKGWSANNFMGTDLSGKTIGLIGVGSIGSEVARILYKGFGATILYYDTKQNSKIENEYAAKKVDSLKSLLVQSDFVSIHVPLLSSTYHLLNREHFSYMKPTAFLINTARGPVVDEKALISALKNNTIKGAGLDVFEFEPKVDRALRKLKNTILTPHIASARPSARNKMAELAAQNIVDFFEGKIPKNKIS